MRDRSKKVSSKRDLEKRATQILESGTITYLGPNQYRVSSQSEEGKYYTVNFLDIWKCTCAYHTNGHGDCKHIMVVQSLVMKTEKLQPANFVIETPELVCNNEKCKSSNYVFCEKHIQQYGVAIRYRCRDCGKKFTDRPICLGRHYPDNVYTDALEDMATGKSAAEVSRGIEKSLNSNVKEGDSSKKRAPHPTTIGRWVKNASTRTSNICKKIPIQVGSKWSTDEIYYKSNGVGMWMYTVEDTESKFILASDTSEDKLGYDATDLFEDAVDTADTKPTNLTSDKLGGFKKGFDNVMKKFQATHVRSAAVNKHHIHNNAHENQNGKFKRIIRVARGFATKFPPVLQLYLLYHNFIRLHMTLKGKTPAEVIGIHVKGTDKWATILAYASAHC